MRYSATILATSAILATSVAATVPNHKPITPPGWDKYADERGFEGYDEPEHLVRARSMAAWEAEHGGKAPSYNAHPYEAASHSGHFMERSMPYEVVHGEYEPHHPSKGMHVAREAKMPYEVVHEEYEPHHPFKGMMFAREAKDEFDTPYEEWLEHTYPEAGKQHYAREASNAPFEDMPYEQWIEHMYPEASKHHARDVHNAAIRPEDERHYPGYDEHKPHTHLARAVKEDFMYGSGHSGEFTKHATSTHADWPTHLPAYAGHFARSVPENWEKFEEDFKKHESMSHSSWPTYHARSAPADWEDYEEKFKHESVAHSAWPTATHKAWPTHHARSAPMDWENFEESFKHESIAHPTWPTAHSAHAAHPAHPSHHPRAVPEDWESHFT